MHWLFLAPLDALHRQIGIPKGSGLLLRKNEQTAIEGSCRASGRHGSAQTKVECTARTHGLLHSAKRDDKRFSRSAGADPSVGRRWSPPRADAAKLEEGRGDARFVLAVRARCHW